MATNWIYEDPADWPEEELRGWIQDGWKYCPSCERLRKIEKFYLRKLKSGGVSCYGDCKEGMGKYNAGIRHKYLPQKRAASQASRSKLRYDVLSAYCFGLAPECACCGETTLEFLALDHTNGGGNKHKKDVGHVYRWVKKNNFPGGFRVLCHNCNQSLGAYGYCPHQKDTTKTTA